MKKLFLAFIFFASSGVFAETEVTSIRTSSDVIEVGSSVDDVKSKLGNPESEHRFYLRIYHQIPRSGTKLSYVIDNKKYTIMIVRDVVYKIVLEQ